MSKKSRQMEFQLGSKGEAPRVQRNGKVPKARLEPVGGDARGPAQNQAHRHCEGGEMSAMEEVEARIEAFLSTSATTLDLMDGLEFESEEEVCDALEKSRFLPNLEVLKIRGVDISKGEVELPDWLTDMPLKGLAIGGSIACLPPTIRKMQSLRVLSLEAYSNEPYPYEIFDLKNLHTLAFVDIPQEHDEQPFLGSDDQHIGKLKKLEVLGIIDCYTFALPDEIGQLVQLRDLNLYGSQFIYSFPDSFARLTSLKRLDIRDTPLGEKIPAAIRNLPDIEILEGARPTFW